MRTKKTFWIIIAAFALCATPIQAQGFGGILKKAKKVLTPSSEPAKTETPPSEASSQQCRRRAYRNWRNPHQSFKRQSRRTVSRSIRQKHIRKLRRGKPGVEGKDDCQQERNQHWRQQQLASHAHRRRRQRERATLFRMDSLLRLGRHLYENRP